MQRAILTRQHSRMNAGKYYERDGTSTAGTGINWFFLHAQKQVLNVRLNDRLMGNI